MFNIFGTSRLIGVDLGSKSLKLIEISKYKDSYILENYIIIEIQTEARIGSILETSQLFTETLGKIIEENIKGWKTKDIFFVAPILYTFSTYFSLPYMPINSLKEAVKYEARKYLPTSEVDFYTEFRNTEYQIIEEHITNRWFIFFTALPTNFVEKLKKVAILSKLNFKGVDIEYFSYEGLFKKQRGSILIVNVGYGYSYWVILNEGKTVLGQKMKFNLKNMITSLANVLNIDTTEAEKFFINKGFKILPGEENLEALYSSFITSLTSEIQKAVDFYKENFDKKIERIYLTGGISLLDNLLEAMSTKIQAIPLLILNPEDFIYISDNLKNRINLPTLSTVIGSCLNFFLR